MRSWYYILHNLIVRLVRPEILRVVSTVIDATTNFIILMTKPTERLGKDARKQRRRARGFSHLV